MRLWVLSVVEEAHHRADRIAIRFRSHQAEPDASVARELIVAIEKCRAVVGGQQEVHVAVAIEVAVGQTAADLWLIEPAADFASHVAKFSVALIEKKLRRLRVADVAADVAHRFVDVTVGHR